MHTAGIVCEYNPFHQGHAYHLQLTKKLLGEDTGLICVMTGDFVQRGEAAVYSKFARAEAACRSGADLVIELPLPWCIASAEGFARGAVGLLGKLGAETISFGSEAGEIEPLDRIAQELLRPTLQAEIREKQEKDAGLSYAAARQIAVEERIGELGGQLALPNNILGIEYLKACYDLGLEMKAITVQRYGSDHDAEGQNGPKSASELRRMIRLNRNTEDYLPKEAFAVYEKEKARGRGIGDASMLEQAILSRMRMLDRKEYNALPDAGDGLGNRLYEAAMLQPTLDAVAAAAKTKRYALSRIRRMCMCAALGVRSGMADGIPGYARVLAANERGRAMLRDISAKGTLPVITKPASAKDLPPNDKQVFALGARAHDLYVLGYKAIEERRGGEDWKTSPFII